MSAAIWALAAWGGVCVVAAMLTRMQAKRQEIAEMPAEIRKCNDEFAEAVELYRYGAVDEAVDLARNWRRRLKA